MIGGLIAFFEWPSFRNTLLSLPLTALVGINACRIGGAGFLILNNQGRLAAPFATSAGWGDIITGLAAIHWLSWPREENCPAACSLFGTLLALSI
jgi:hypothetical protein